MILTKPIADRQPLFTDEKPARGCCECAVSTPLFADFDTLDFPFDDPPTSIEDFANHPNLHLATCDGEEIPLVSYATTTLWGTCPANSSGCISANNAVTGPEACEEICNRVRDTSDSDTYLGVPGLDRSDAQIPGCIEEILRRTGYDEESNTYHWERIQSPYASQSPLGDCFGQNDFDSYSPNQEVIILDPISGFPRPPITVDCTIPTNPDFERPAYLCDNFRQNASFSNPIPVTCYRLEVLALVDACGNSICVLTNLVIPPEINCCDDADEQVQFFYPTQNLPQWAANACYLPNGNIGTCSPPFDCGDFNTGSVGLFYGEIEISPTGDTGPCCGEENIELSATIVHTGGPVHAGGASISWCGPTMYRRISPCKWEVARCVFVCYPSAGCGGGKIYVTFSYGGGVVPDDDTPGIVPCHKYQAFLIADVEYNPDASCS